MKLQDLLLTEEFMADLMEGRRDFIKHHPKAVETGSEFMVIATAQLSKIKKHIRGSREEMAIISCANHYRNKVRWIKGIWAKGDISDNDKKRWRELADQTIKALIGEED